MVYNMDRIGHKLDKWISKFSFVNRQTKNKTINLVAVCTLTIGITSLSLEKYNYMENRSEEFMTVLNESSHVCFLGGPTIQNELSLQCQHRCSTRMLMHQTDRYLFTQSLESNTNA